MSSLSANPGIEGVPHAPLRLKQVTETPCVLAAEFLDHLTCLSVELLSITGSY